MLSGNAVSTMARIAWYHPTPQAEYANVDLWPPTTAVPITNIVITGPIAPDQRTIAKILRSVLSLISIPLWHVRCRHTPHAAHSHIAHRILRMMATRSHRRLRLCFKESCRRSGLFALDSYVKPASLFSSVQRCAQLIYGQGRTKQTQKSMSL
jgi:hypothetical protein